MRLNNTTKIVLITFFSNLYFYNHVGTLYFQSRGLTLLQTTSITSIIVITIFLAEVPTGVLADRIGRKWSVVIALLLQTVGEVLFIFSTSYGVFAFIAIIAGVGFAFASGATESLVYDTLPLDNRDAAMKRAMGNVGSAYHLAFFAAPLLGGLLVTEFALSKYLLVIVLTACAVAVALVISLTLEKPATDYDATVVNPLEIFRKGVANLRHNHPLRHILLVTIFTSTFMGVLVSLYQPYFVANNASPFMVGGGLALGGLLAAFAQRNAYRLQELIGERAGLVAATVAPGILYIVLGTVTGRLPVFIVFVLTYAVLQLKNPIFSAYQNRYIDDRSRATTLSLMNMFSSLFIALMSLVYGALADHSLPVTFVVLGGVILLASLVLRIDRVLPVHRYGDTE